MKILSIDFDYFQNVTKKILRDYPDGIDLGTSLSKIVWAVRYVEGNPAKKQIESVTLNQDLFDSVMEILSKQRSCIPVMVHQSHVDAYDFICEQMEEQEANELELFNIDFHHDIINECDTLDCGNWIRHLKEAYPETKVTWIARELSLECYGLEDSIKALIELSLDKIQDMQFDAVFICRSDSWSPPHLDIHFQLLLQYCINWFDNIKIENCVSYIRNISFETEQEREISLLLNNINNEMKQGVENACSNPTQQ